MLSENSVPHDGVGLLSKWRSLREAGHAFRVWWSAPVDHRAQVEYFAVRGLLGVVQLLIGTCCLLLALVPATLLFSPTGPQTPVTRAVSLAFNATALAWTLRWWLGPWPSRRWSIGFIIYADLGITTVSLMDSNRLAGLFGLTTFVLVSLYIQFFEGPRLLACHIAWIFLVIATFAVALGAGPSGDPALATAKTIAAVPGLAITPVVIQFGLWLLCADATQSKMDQLTSTLNRRGLKLHLERRLLDETDLRRYGVMVAMVIDLDNFKRVNDTHGHSVGDEVLVRTARRIQVAVRPRALVARIGGEEFLVVDLAESQAVPQIAEGVRDAIASRADEVTITASIGVATTALGPIQRPPRDVMRNLDAAIDCADRAMFVAKRQGGNGIHYADDLRGIDDSPG